MSEPPRSLSDLIGAVADGTLDLDGLLGSAPEGPMRELLAELRIIAGVADVHRSQVIADTPAVTGADSLPSDPLTAPDRPSARWGNFQLLRKIGEGSFGDVYLARDLWLDHEVALKLVKPHVADRSLILKEARKLVRVRHPNVVTVHGADIQDGRVGFWMDFIDGPTLADVIRREGVRTVDEATAWGKDLCRALAAVHAAGVIHRDIKAQNVIRQRSDGRLILMDFGAGQFIDPRSETEVSAAGTPLYLAPELLDGGRGTERSDIYALGVLLFYLISGRFPIEASSWDALVAAHARGDRHRLADLRPDVSDTFAAVVRRTLSPAAIDRFSTVGSVREALEELEPRARPGPAFETRASTVAMSMVAASAFVTFTGYLCSTLYNSPLNRTGGFEDESPLAWPVWGLKALIASGIVMAVLALAFIVLRRVAHTIGIPFRHWIDPTRRAVVARIPAAIRSSSTLVPWLFIAQAAILAASGWAFRDMLTGLDSFISRRPPVDFSALAPENQPRQILFAVTICTQVLIFSAAWLRVARSHWRAANGEMRANILGGAFLLAVAFFGGQIVPYRILYQNKNERVVYGSQRCYLVGTRGNDGRLFCPVQPPLNRAVKLDDPALKRDGVVENIFSGLAPGTH